MSVIHDDANGELAPVVGLLGVGGGGSGSDFSLTGSATRAHAIMQHGVGAALASEPLDEFYADHYLLPGETDYGAALARVATAVTANGGGRIIFRPGTYPIFGSAGGFLANFSGLTGICIICYGATFAISTTNPAYMVTAGYGALFNFTDCTNIFIDGVNVTGPDVRPNFLTSVLCGANIAQFNRGCTNVYIPNMRVQGAQAAVIFPNTLANVGSPNRNINIGNLDVRQTFYGLNGSYGIHGLRCGLLKTVDVYRSMPMHADLRDIDVNVWSKNAYGHDVAVSAKNGHGMNGVKIRYKREVDSTGPTEGGTHCIQMGFGDTTPAIIRDVDISMNIEYAPTPQTGVGAFRFIKTTDGDTADTVDRGHVTDGIRISGVIKGTPQFTTRAMISTQAEARFGPTLDAMRGVAFRDLTIETTLTDAIDWDCGAIDDVVIRDNVNVGSSNFKVRDFAGGTNPVRVIEMGHAGSLAGDKALLQYDGNQATRARVRNADATGAAAFATFRAEANAASNQIDAYCDGNTETRWGVTLGGWSELLAVVSVLKGLAIGTASPGGPLRLGVSGQTRAFFGIAKNLTESVATGLCDVSLANDTVIGGTLFYTVDANDGTTQQARRGSVPFVATNSAGTVSSVAGTPVEIMDGAGTLTAAFTITNGAAKITLNLNAVSSLTQTTLRCSYTVLLDGGTGNPTP